MLAKTIPHLGETSRPGGHTLMLVRLFVVVLIVL